MFIAAVFCWELKKQGLKPDYLEKLHHIVNMAFDLSWQKQWEKKP